MTKFENAKKIPATIPQPSAARKVRIKIIFAGWRLMAA